jgi:hypothetical protein
VNDNDPIAEGDTVQRRGHPSLRRSVWSIEDDMIIVEWEDPDENAYIRDPRQLEKITPLPQRPGHGYARFEPAGVREHRCAGCPALQTQRYTELSAAPVQGLLALIGFRAMDHDPSPRGRVRVMGPKGGNALHRYLPHVVLLARALCASPCSAANDVRGL